MCCSPRRVAARHSFLTFTDLSWACRIQLPWLNRHSLSPTLHTPEQRGSSLRRFFSGRAMDSLPTRLLKFSAPSSSIAHPLPIPANATGIFHHLCPPQAQGRFILLTSALTVLLLPEKPLALRPQTPAQHLCVPSPQQPRAPQLSPLHLLSLPGCSPAFSLQTHLGTPSYPPQIFPGHSSRLLISSTLWHTVMNKAPLGDLRE